MSDHPAASLVTEAERIDIDDPRQVLRWAEDLQLSEAHLWEAIRKVGTRVDALRLYRDQQSLT